MKYGFNHENENNRKKERMKKIMKWNGINENNQKIEIMKRKWNNEENNNEK